MRKYLLLLSLILVLFLLLQTVTFLKQKIGDLRPVILPPTQDLGKTLETAPSTTQTPNSSATPVKVAEQVDSPLKLPSGFHIGIFAKGLGTPRDLEFSPGGTLLVSIPEEGKIVALPDTNNDGIADKIETVSSGLDRPHGLTFHENKLYIAEMTQVRRFLWNESELSIKTDKFLFNIFYYGGHNTRHLVFDKKGQLFVTVGSSCNVCVEKHDWLAGIIVSDQDGNNPRLFAKGLRNSVFLTVNPQTDEIWAGDMGRDYLGDDLPPEEINILRDGRDYGWPICYGQKIHDTNFDRSAPPDSAQGKSSAPACENTEAPVFEYQAHAAPLGLTFINSPQFPQDWQGDLLVAYHGSWNRSSPVGYKVVHMDVEGNTIKEAQDFLTGFLQGSRALGRPVDVIFDRYGSLYISDDKAGAIYKIIRN